MIRRRFLLAALSGAAFTLACGSGSDDPARTPDPEPTSTSAPAGTVTSPPSPLASVTGGTTPLATQVPGPHGDALLTAEELGEGWDHYPVAGQPFATQIYCGEVIEPLVADSFATLINTQAKRTIYHAITTLDDEAAAAAYIERLSKVIHDCTEWTSGQGANVVNWKTTGIGTELPFGDSSIEQIATTQLPDRMSPSATYSIIVRDGATVMILSMFLDGQPDQTAFPIAAYAWEKLTGEDVSEP
jgi:hypothetical protein